MEPGAVLDGKYRLVRRLGQGGMGEVWEADDLNLDRRVAVKIVLSNLGTNQELIQRLRREARAAASLQHPGITVVHDMGDHDGHPFFVMELLHGRDFLAVLVDNPQGLPPARATALALGVAEALAHAHRKGVVHRDIKPANLMELAEGGVKICDFGVARLADAASPRLTQTGIIVGTPPFTAPEQFQGGRADARTDLYSFGCTLYALLTGQPPFTGPSVGAYMNQHLTEQPPRPGSLRAGIPADLERLVLRLLAKDPADRPAMADVLAGLRSLTAAPAPTASEGRTLVEPARDPLPPPAPPPGLPQQGPGHPVPDPGRPAPGGGLPPDAGLPQQAPDPGHPAPAPGHPAPAPGQPGPGLGHPGPGSGQPAPGPGQPVPGAGQPAAGGGPSPAPGHPAPAPGHPAPGPGHPAPGSGLPQSGMGLPGPRRPQDGPQAVPVAGPSRGQAATAVWRALASVTGRLFRAPGRAGLGDDPALRRDGVGLSLVLAGLLGIPILWTNGDTADRLADPFEGLFGVCAVLLPALAFVLAGRTFRHPERREENRRWALGGSILALALIAAIHVTAGTPDPDRYAEKSKDAGGILGYLVAGPLKAALTPWGAVPLLLLLMGLGVLIITATPVSRVPELVGRLIAALARVRPRRPQPEQPPRPEHEETPPSR
ncbi:serine/threonine-protein kinase [Thermomonospora umbrina]|uniref:non-specific serine/threonine protein kinase n=1 Tax=Thermomonospora umbrina TaxID=111806 RepID=A0A3D9SP17_9ACTN|nr:serine/threonine-protein kinase [Thermomonospora umbrina]REE97648.1 serine/threonine protein kinase [Thermomonospora umbrina]